LLARFTRHRLAAEMMRDQALFISGLLVEQRGGPPVKPYQPEGLWEEKSGTVYTRDVGDGSRRRSLYTYWKRTSPPPSMMILDAANREVCTARRQTTASPLQALVAWNDPQYVEAARGLAQRVWREAAGDRDRQLEMLFRWTTSRRPEAVEIEVLRTMYAQQQAYFAAQPESATAFLATGDLPRDEDFGEVEQAALAAVAGALLSYDETITQR
jgi:hypothetical protein